MGIADVADELYGLAPQDFTAARNARARAARDDGDRELAAAVMSLRKPTAGAWLLNQLVRQHRGEVEEVLELGIRLRAAQGTLGAADLRALDEQRRQLTRAVAGQAVSIAVAAGRTVSAPVAADVEETLRSAMVDPDAGAALASGLLTDTFSASGLDPVDLSRVVALRAQADAQPGPTPTGEPTSTDAASEARAARAARAVADAERAVEAAEEALRDAHARSEATRQRAVEARRRREGLESQLAEVRRHLADLESQVAASSDTEDEARRAQVSATRSERSATEAAARARHDLRALRDGTDA